MVDGTLQSVTIEPLGSVLLADAAVGATVLSLDWAVDFAEAGGQLRVDLGAVLEFVSADQDLDTVTLAKPLTVAAFAGDSVDVVGVRDQPAQKWIAVVELDDDQEPVDAIIPLGLIRQFREGDDQAGAQVSLRRDEHGDYVVTGRPDDVPEEPFAADQSSATAAGSGPVTITLAWEPMLNSEHVYWNGVYQPSSEWTRSGKTITFLDAEGYLKAGDVITVEYLYSTAQPETFVPLPDPVLVGTTSATSDPTSVALPAGTQAGDLIVAVVAFNGGSATNSDPRLTNQITGSGYLIAWGTATSSSSNVLVSASTAFSYSCACVAVYRGATVASATAATVAGSNPLSGPTVDDATAALVVAFQSDGLIASGNSNPDSLGNYTQDAGRTYGKSGCSINRWVANVAQTSPPSSFVKDGSFGTLGAVALKLAGVSS